MLRMTFIALASAALAVIAVPAQATVSPAPVLSVDAFFDPPPETIESSHMDQIEIICRSPGFRRCGIAHPAAATYPADRWNDDDLAVLRGDPMFSVREMPLAQVSNEVRRSAAAGDPGGIEAQLAVAPGASRADQVFDNGAGPTVAHLDAEPTGTREAAPAPATVASEVVGETVVPGGDAAPGTGADPVFANDRVEAIRSLLAELGDGDKTRTGRPKLVALEAKLGFRPEQKEVEAALVEAVAPKAVAKT